MVQVSDNSNSSSYGSGGYDYDSARACQYHACHLALFFVFWITP